MKIILSLQKSEKRMRRFAALIAACALLFSQTDAHAFLALSSPVSSQNIFDSQNSLQQNSPVLAEKSLVQNAIIPLEAPKFEIPQSVLAQFNPLGKDAGSFHSKIYYDPSGRRVFRHELSNQNYFEVYRQGSSIETGKIRELKLAASHNYKFHYFSQHNRPAVRIVQNMVSQNNHPYQAFEISEDGRLGRVLETGFYDNKQFVRERVYNYKSGTITLSRPGNIYEKRVYELKPTGEAGRPIQYRNRTAAGELIHVRFLYNDEENTITCLHVNGLHFAVYEYSAGNVLGSLLKIGAAKSVSKEGRIIPQSEIELSVLRRGRQFLPVYVFREAGVPGYVVRERSLEGAEGLGVIGRVLRFSAENADLEYFYGERRGNQAGSLTVVNHITGDRLRFELPEKVFDESHGRLVPSEDLKQDLVWANLINSMGKQAVLKDDLVFALTGYHLILKGQRGEHESIAFLRRLLRGPPAEGLELFASASAFTLSALFLSSSFIRFTSSKTDSADRLWRLS